MRTQHRVDRISVYHKPPPGKRSPAETFLVAKVTVLKGDDEWTSGPLAVLNCQNGSQSTL